MLRNIVLSKIKPAVIVYSVWELSKDSDEECKQMCKRLAKYHHCNAIVVESNGALERGDHMYYVQFIDAGDDPLLYCAIQEVSSLTFEASRAWRMALGDYFEHQIFKATHCGAESMSELEMRLTIAGY